MSALRGTRIGRARRKRQARADGEAGKGRKKAKKGDDLARRPPLAFSLGRYDQGKTGQETRRRRQTRPRRRSHAMKEWKETGGDRRRQADETVGREKGCRRQTGRCRQPDVGNLLLLVKPRRGSPSRVRERVKEKERNQTSDDFSRGRKKRISCYYTRKGFNTGSGEGAGMGGEFIAGSRSRLTLKAWKETVQGAVKTRTTGRKKLAETGPFRLPVMLIRWRARGHMGCRGGMETEKLGFLRRL